MSDAPRFGLRGMLVAVMAPAMFIGLPAGVFRTDSPSTMVASFAVALLAPLALAWQQEPRVARDGFLLGVCAAATVSTTVWLLAGTTMSRLVNTLGSRPWQSDDISEFSQSVPGAVAVTLVACLFAGDIVALFQVWRQRGTWTWSMYFGGTMLIYWLFLWNARF